jgi:hypothetical protein
MRLACETKNERTREKLNEMARQWMELALEEEDQLITAPPFNSWKDRIARRDCAQARDGREWRGDFPTAAPTPRAAMRRNKQT